MYDDMNQHQMQLELEQITNKNQVMPRLRKLFTNDTIINHCEEHGIPMDFGIDLLCHMAVQKRAKFKVLFGLMAKHFPDTEYGYQQCADMITKAALYNLCRFDMRAGEFVVVIEMPEDVEEELAKFQFPMPMVTAPRKLKHNRSNAYLTGGGAVISKWFNYHDNDVCLDHLNQMNQVKMTMNPDTGRMVKNHWKDLDHQKEDETKEEYVDRVKAFLNYDRNAKDVMELIYLAGNEFHMTHKYDKRGRTYCQGYHINPQGSCWNKAVVEFANKEIIE